MGAMHACPAVYCCAPARACKLASTRREYREPSARHSDRVACLLSVASSSLNCSVNAQSAASPQSTGPQMPSDIDPRSGMRLPLPNREDLDEAGKKAYDRGTTVRDRKSTRLNSSHQ